LVNTGYCWKAHINSEGAMLSGGPLTHEYQLEQYHCHWGETNEVGAEHLVNGKSYAAEVKDGIVPRPTSSARINLIQVNLNDRSILSTGTPSMALSMKLSNMVTAWQFWAFFLR